MIHPTSILDLLDRPILDLLDRELLYALWGPPAGQPHDMPDIKVEVAWEADPLDPDPTWTRIDETACPRRLSITRGVRMRTGETETGTAVCLIDNRTRSLDPNNPDSPYAPNVLPRRRIRFTIDPDDGPEQVVFTGYIDQYAPWWDTGDGTIELTAVDLLGVLATAPRLPSVVQIETLNTSPAHYWPLTEQQGTTAVDLAADTDGTYLAGVYYTRAELLPYADATGIVASTDQRFTVGDVFPSFGSPGPWTRTTFRMWITITDYDPGRVIALLQDRVYADPRPGSITANPANDSAVALSLAGDADNPAITVTICEQGQAPITSTISTPSLADKTAHQIGLYINAVSGVETPRVELWVDGIEVGEVTPGQQPLAAATGWMRDLHVGYGLLGGTNPDATATIGHVAIWSTPPPNITGPKIDFAADYAAGAAPWDGDTTGQRIERWLDVLGIPDADRDIDLGHEICSPARGGMSPIDALHKINATELGALFVAADGKLTFRQRPLVEIAPTTVTLDDHPGIDVVPYADIRPVYGTDRIVNTVEVHRDNGDAVRAESSAWRALLGELSVSMDTLHVSVEAARAHADRVLARSAEPRTVIEQVELAPRHPDVPSSASIGIELGAMIEVVARPTGDGPAITQRARVEKLEQSWDWQGWDWRCRIGLDERRVLVPDAELVLPASAVYQQSLTDTTYMTAAGGTTPDEITGAEHTVGQLLDSGDYTIYQTTIEFDVTPWLDILGDLDQYFTVELRGQTSPKSWLATPAASPASGYVYCEAASLFDAREGDGSLVVSSPLYAGGFLTGGQVRMYQSFIAFDVSSLPAGLEIDHVEVEARATLTDQPLNVRLYHLDFGDEVETTDFVPFSDLWPTGPQTLAHANITETGPVTWTIVNSSQLTYRVNLARADDGKVRMLLAAPFAGQNQRALFSTSTNFIRLRVYGYAGEEFVIEARVDQDGGTAQRPWRAPGADTSAWMDEWLLNNRTDLIASRTTAVASFTTNGSHLVDLLNTGPTGEQILALQIVSDQHRQQIAPTGDDTLDFDPDRWELVLVPLEDES